MEISSNEIRIYIPDLCDKNRRLHEGRMKLVFGASGTETTQTELDLCIRENERMSNSRKNKFHATFDDTHPNVLTLPFKTMVNRRVVNNGILCSVFSTAIYILDDLHTVHNAHCTCIEKKLQHQPHAFGTKPKYDNYVLRFFGFSHSAFGGTHFQFQRATVDASHTA